MPTSNRDITERPKVEDESVGRGSEHHGKHREGDEALPGSGGDKAGLNKAAGRSDDSAESSRGTKQSDPDRPGPA
jgi:hypothetical protein